MGSDERCTATAALHAGRNVDLRPRRVGLAERVRRRRSGVGRAVRTRRADLGDGPAVVRPVTGWSAGRVLPERGGVRAVVHRRPRHRTFDVGRSGWSRAVDVAGRRSGRTALRRRDTDANRTVRHVTPHDRSHPRCHLSSHDETASSRPCSRPRLRVVGPRAARTGAAGGAVRWCRAARPPLRRRAGPDAVLGARGPDRPVAGRLPPPDLVLVEPGMGCAGRGSARNDRARPGLSAGAERSMGAARRR